VAKPKITVMGSFVVDLMGRAPHLPAPGETVKGSSFKLGPGGKGSNQGVAAQRAGADVTMITKIGTDLFGQVALDSFNKEGIDTKFVFQDEKYPSGTALILVDENTSENSILVTLDACGHITDEDIEAARENIENAELFLTQLETNIDAMEKAIDIAYKKGIKIILNPAPIQPIQDELLKKVYILTPNEVEASILSGVEIKDVDSAREATQVLQGKGAENVIITLGSKGALVATKETEKYIPCAKVNAIDTTGAGDSYNGALVVALAEGMDIFEAAEFANAAAALSVTKIGTAPAMPYRSEIDNFLKSIKGE
jgi:ribokinase